MGTIFFPLLNCHPLITSLCRSLDLITKYVDIGYFFFIKCASHVSYSNSIFCNYIMQCDWHGGVLKFLLTSSPFQRFNIVSTNSKVVKQLTASNPSSLFFSSREKYVLKKTTTRRETPHDPLQTGFLKKTTLHDISQRYIYLLFPEMRGRKRRERERQETGGRLFL